ncbi:MAG: hypothetical protein AAGC81_03825 [Pseudomonadota bacterium]
MTDQRKPSKQDLEEVEDADLDKLQGGRGLQSQESQKSVLLFDEADAVFGKRTQVKDNHSSYANVEVSYVKPRSDKS